MQVRKRVLTALGECDQSLVKLLHQGDVTLKLCDPVKQKTGQGQLSLTFTFLCSDTACLGANDAHYITFVG